MDSPSDVGFVGQPLHGEVSRPVSRASRAFDQE